MLPEYHALILPASKTASKIFDDRRWTIENSFLKIEDRS